MQLKVKKLFENTIIYAVGNFGSRILAFCLLPIYSYYLTKDAFGYFDIIITTITLIAPLVTFQLSDSIFRWLINLDEKDEYEKKCTISNGFFVILISFSFVILISIAGYFLYSIQYYLPVVLLLLTSSFFPLIQQTVRGLGKARIYAFSGVIYSVVLLTSTGILLVIYNLSILALIIAAVLANIIASIYVLYRCNVFLYYESKCINKTKIKDLLRYSMPLIPNTISWWLVNSANKYFIFYYLGMDANGIFGFANRFPAILVIINSIFMLAWQESAITNFDDKDKVEFFSKIFTILIWVQITAASVLTLSSEFIVRHLISHEFYESWEYMSFLFFGVAFSTLAGFFGAMYLSTKETKAALITSIFGGLINILLCFIFIRPYGLFAVAVATCVSFFVLFFIRYIHTKKYMRLNFSISDSLLLFLIVVASVFVNYYSDNLGKLELIIAVSTMFVIKVAPPVLILYKTGRE